MTEDYQGSSIKRTFIPGSKWLFYKFYSGHITGELILRRLIKPLTNKLLKDQLIDQWFFVRYADPEPHLRVRLHLTASEYLQGVLSYFKDSIQKKFHPGRIYKIQIDTYQREIERYGSFTIEQSEKLFFNDSQMVIKLLDIINGDEGESIRWLFSMRSINSLLNDFKYNMNQKLELLRRLNQNFSKEFNKDTILAKQLSKKYRDNLKEIHVFLNADNNTKHNFPDKIFQITRERSKLNTTIVEEIRALQEKGKLTVPVDIILESYIHMIMNRIFRSRQRLHEMVIYDFLFRHYKSQVAKLKYQNRSSPQKSGIAIPFGLCDDQALLIYD
jgi:thiopeptide-type bacteriocin biosynthesis protein